jgi:soluble lytic murein transglycosylase
MQIMPKTGVYLAELLEWDIRGKTISELTYHSNSNIEMGVFYLKKLLKKFRNNYKLATCAYNMGPGWVVNQLRNRRPVGIRNKYFNKVSKNYHRLVHNMRTEFKKRIPPYQETYVARWKRRRPNAKKHMALPFGLPIDFASSQIKNLRNRKARRRSVL